MIYECRGIHFLFVFGKYLQRARSQGGPGGGWGREGLSCTCGALVGFWLTSLLLRGLDPSHRVKFHVTKANGNEELCNY